MSLKFETLNQNTVRFVEAKGDSIVHALAKCHNKKVVANRLFRKTNLNGENTSKITLLLELETELTYTPGDHVGVFATNKPELVDGILKRLKGPDDLNTPVELQVLKETHTSNGVMKTWTPHERLPVCSLRELFSRFLDVTTPPSPNLLQYFSSIATDEEDQRKLNLLATDSAAYEDWRHWRFPHLLEVLEEFPSVQPNAALLAAQLGLLQPRFYSISSSQDLHPGQVHLTVAVVVYKTQDGEGPVHYGVCSNYLQDVSVGSDVSLFIRRLDLEILSNHRRSKIIVLAPRVFIFLRIQQSP